MKSKLLRLTALLAVLSAFALGSCTGAYEAAKEGSSDPMPELGRDKRNQ